MGKTHLPRACISDTSCFYIGQSAIIVSGSYWLISFLKNGVSDILPLTRLEKEKRLRHAAREKSSETMCSVGYSDSVRPAQVSRSDFTWNRNIWKHSCGRTPFFISVLSDVSRVTRPRLCTILFQKMARISRSASRILFMASSKQCRRTFLCFTVLICLFLVGFQIGFTSTPSVVKHSLQLSSSTIDEDKLVFWSSDFHIT